MLLTELVQLIEMARPAKICPDCGKSMSGNHYWYKGGWRCKKSSKEGTPAKEKSEKEAVPAKEKKMTRAEKKYMKSKEKFLAHQKKIFRNISDADLKKAGEEYDKSWKKVQDETE